MLTTPTTANSSHGLDAWQHTPAARQPNVASMDPPITRSSAGQRAVRLQYACSESEGNSVHVYICTLPTLHMHSTRSNATAQYAARKQPQPRFVPAWHLCMDGWIVYICTACVHRQRQQTYTDIAHQHGPTGTQTRHKSMRRCTPCISNNNNNNNSVAVLQRNTRHACKVQPWTTPRRAVAHVRAPPAAARRVFNHA